MFKCLYTIQYKKYYRHVNQALNSRVYLRTLGLEYT